ncbi:MAG TPA: alpha-amylase family glycosyl hydrolase [Saprospiraceae bacterium]|nr:alpha-amylase family glycosyl hydrolase [Saprospiraceae bacterium]
MKLLQTCSLITILFHLISVQSKAQVVWTVPAFPTKNDDITVYYDASEGNAALAGFTGPVYAHTGVITDLSTSGSDWKHVIGNWGTADARVLMHKESQDLYSISYNITDFYGIPANELVLKLAFVFRNVTGTIVGRDSDGADIYSAVAPSGGGLYLTLLSPDNGENVVLENDSILIDLLASDTADILVFDNGELIFSEHSDHVTFYHHPSVTGNHVLRFEATNEFDALLFGQYIVLKNNQTKLDPPPGVLSGLNYYTDSTYIFQVYAPLKKYAFLLTISNLFQPDTSYLMHVGEDGSTFWIELPRSLFLNGNNVYQYLFDGGIRVADPLSEVVLDPSNDAFINPSVMATLPSYPTGLTQGIVTAFDEEYQSFDFTDFDKPEKSKLVIYELLLRDFLADHSYTSLEDTLDYFVKLGVTAIELMPVNEFEGNISWGYNPDFHMALDKYYGTREQLKSFVNAAHQRGIAVILDVVFNHTFGQGPLAQMYWDAANSRPSAESPYLNPIPKHPFNVGYDFNHESPATKTWVKRILRYWMAEFKIDGFRFDLSKGMTQFNSGNDAGLMARYDAGRIEILKDYANTIWSVAPDAYVILEHFADNSEEIVLSDYGMMLWGNINFQFSQAAKGFQSDLEGIDYTFKGWDDPHVIGYMESHDEERAMYRTLTEGDSEGSYNTRNLATALKRMEAANAVFYSLPGPRMIWEFGELGYDFSINRCANGTISGDCRLDPKPIRWDYLLDERRLHLHDVTADLIYLKNNYPTFSTDNFLFTDANLFVKTVHLNHVDMDAVTLVNFRVINSDINPKFQHIGTWYEYFTGDSIEVTDTQKKITFGPGEYRIYTSKRIVPPHGFITATHDLSATEINLYPNVISEETVLHAVIPDVGNIISVTISDLAGKTMQLEFSSNGEEGFDIFLQRRISAGVYVINILTEHGYYVGKIVKE